MLTIETNLVPIPPIRVPPENALQSSAQVAAKCSEQSETISGQNRDVDSLKHENVVLSGKQASGILSQRKEGGSKTFFPRRDRRDIPTQILIWFRIFAVFLDQTASR